MMSSKSARSRPGSWSSNKAASASSPRSGRFIPWKERSSARLIRLREPRASTSGPARRSATIRVAARILKLRGDTVGKSVSDPGRPGIVHREGMAGIVRHSQTKGRETGNAKPGLKPPMVGADISASEGPTEAVPGVGSGRSTQERGQSKRPRIAAGRAATPVGSKRPTGGGRPRAVWQRRRATRG